MCAWEERKSQGAWERGRAGGPAGGAGPSGRGRRPASCCGFSGGRQFPGAKELAGLCLARHNQLRSRSRSPGVAAARGAGERAARGREQGGGVHGGLLLCVSVSVSVSVSGAVWSDLSFERVTVGNRLQGPGRVG